MGDVSQCRNQKLQNNHLKNFLPRKFVLNDIKIQLLRVVLCLTCLFFCKSQNSFYLSSVWKTCYVTVRYSRNSEKTDGENILYSTDLDSYIEALIFKFKKEKQSVN